MDYHSYHYISGEHSREPFIPVLVGAAVGVAVAGVLFGSKDKAKITQEVINKVNLSFVNDFKVDNSSIIEVSSSNIQNAKVITEDLCQVKNLVINQSIGEKVKLVNINDTNIQQEIFDKASAALQTSMKSAAEDINKKLFDALDKQRDSELVSKLNNIFEQSFTNNFKVTNFTQSKYNSENNQRSEIICRAGGENITVNQNILIELDITNQMSNAVKAMLDKQLDVDVKNELEAIYKKVSQDFLSSLFESIGTIGMIIIAVIIFLIILSVIVLFIYLLTRKKGSSQQPMYPPQMYYQPMYPPPMYTPQPQMYSPVPSMTQRAGMTGSSNIGALFSKKR